MSFDSHVAHPASPAIALPSSTDRTVRIRTIEGCSVRGLKLWCGKIEQAFSTGIFTDLDTLFDMES